MGAGIVGLATLPRRCLAAPADRGDGDACGGGGRDGCNSNAVMVGLAVVGLGVERTEEKLGIKPGAHDDPITYHRLTK